jgi:hypothetical protein
VYDGRLDRCGGCIRARDHCFSEQRPHFTNVLRHIADSRNATTTRHELQKTHRNVSSLKRPHVKSMV